MPRTVLINDSACAPAASAARAIGRISVTLGESFAITGRDVPLLTASTVAAVLSGSVEKSRPPATFGHDKLASIPTTLDSPSNCDANAVHVDSS